MNRKYEEVIESKTIAKRLFSGSMLRVTLLVCNLGVSFFMMPFLIHALGDRWYGFWTLIGTFIGYYGFLDLGLSSAVSRFVSRAYGQTDYDEMNTVINTSLALFSFAGFVALVISVMAALLCSYFINDYSEVVLFRKIILILGFSIAVGFPMRAFAGVLTSKIRYDLISYIHFLKLILRTSLIVYFIKNGYGILSLAIITFFVEIMGYSINIYLVKKEFKQLKLSIGRPKVERVKPLFNYSKYTFIAQIADHLRFKVDSFVIAGFLNLSLVTHYFIALRLMEYFGQFITSALGMFSPIYSQYEGRGDLNSIRKWFLGATKISVIFSFFIGSSIIFYGDDFIKRWMGYGYQSSYYVLIILCVPSIFALMQNPGIGLLYGISKHKFYAISNTCEGFLNITLSIILVQYYGIYGVAMGTMIEMLIFKLFIQPIYTCRVINLTVYEYYFKTIFVTALKTLLPLLVYFYVVADMLKPGYMTIFSLAIIQSILFLPIAFYLVLGKKERHHIKIAFGIT